MKLFNKLSLSLVVLTGSIGLLSGSVAAAGAAQFSLGSIGASYTAGTTISVAINENSFAEAVNSIQADLTYDSSTLQYSGFGAGSAFSCPVVSTGSGSVSIGCLVPGGTVSSGQYVGTVNFKVLASSGSSTVAMSQSSIIGRSDATDIWNHANVGFTYSFSPASGGRGGGSAPAATQPRVLADTTPTEEAAPAPAAEKPAAKPVVKPTITLPSAAPVKKSHTGQTIFSIAVLALLILGAIALANREKVAAYMNEMKKKMNARNAAKVVAPAAAVAAATKGKSAAKKKSPAKKKTTAKKSKK